MRARSLVNKINAEFSRQMPEQKAMTGYVTYTPSSFGEILTRAFNTISYAKYHIHLKDGELRCREVAVSTVKLIVAAMMDDGVRHGRDLREGAGFNSFTRCWHSLVCWGDVWWSGLIHRRLYEFYVKWAKPLIAIRHRAQQ